MHGKQSFVRNTVGLVTKSNWRYIKRLNSSRCWCGFWHGECTGYPIYSRYDQVTV